MSVQKARALLRRQHYDGNVLYDLPDHRQFLKYLTGKDCFDDMENTVSEAIRRLDVDMLVVAVPYTPKDKRALESDSNLFGSDVTHWRNSETTSPDIAGHDPLATRQYLSISETELAKLFIDQDARNRVYAGGTALTHGYYFDTCIHYAAMDLDYEKFLCFCMEEPEKLGELLDRYEAASVRALAAWNRCNPEMMFCHDDIANAKSMTFSPAFCREHLMPRYKRLFAPLKASGAPLLFVTDGNFADVARDLIDAGVDGFFVDRPPVDFARLVRLCGEDKIYFTGPTPEIMTNGTPSDVVDEMKMLTEISQSVPGYMFHLGSGWTKNMPVENVKAFYKHLGRL